MQTITTEELKALKEKNADLTLVNILKAEDFEKTKIACAVNIPLESSDFVARVEQEAGGKTKPVVVYCSNSQCNASEKAAKKLMDAGFTDVSRYTCGAEASQQEACETVAGKNC